MASSSITDIVESHIENVRKELPSLFESSQQLAGKINVDKNVVPINRKLYRIPIEVRPGGVYGKFVADGGSLGSGTALKLNSLKAGYYYSRLAFQLTEEMIATTEGQTQATVDAFAREMARGIETAQIHADIELHGDGTGVLTNAATAQGGTTLTFGAAVTTDPFNVGRLREGMAVDVWDSGLTTKRAGAGSGPVIIESINYESKLVTFDQTITALAGTDRLAFAGMDAYGPATPTSFSSTWPATGTAAGLGGDSWRHGIYYSNDNTAANYYLGVQKSTIPQLLPGYVSAASGALSVQHGLQLLDKLRQRRDETQLAGLLGVFHQKQREAHVASGMHIVNKPMNSPSFGPSLDILPSNTGYSDVFEFAGIPCCISKRQRQDRVDFINPAKWGRAEVQALDFYERGGKRLFEGRNTSGEVTALWQWFYIAGYDYVNHDPGCGGYIDGLLVP